jgi:hypothetical protein
VSGPCAEKAVARVLAAINAGARALLERHTRSSPRVPPCANFRGRRIDLGSFEFVVPGDALSASGVSYQIHAYAVG